MVNLKYSFLAQKQDEKHELSATNSVSAYARLENHKSGQKISEFFLQKTSAIFGNLISSPLSSFTEFHIDNCPKIAKKHFKIEYRPDFKAFKITPFSPILINGQPYQCEEFVFNYDVIGFDCSVHNHLLKFTLPENFQKDFILTEKLKSSPLKTTVLKYPWSSTEIDSFSKAVLSFGPFRPSKIRKSVGLAKKSLAEVFLFSVQFVLYLLQNSPQSEDFAEKTLLAEIAKEEDFESLVALGGGPFTHTVWSSLGINGERSEKCIRKIARALFVSELADSQKFRGRSVAASLQNAAENKDLPTALWTPRDDQKLIVSLSKHGADSFEAAALSSFGFSAERPPENEVTPKLLTKRFEAIFRAFLV